MIGGNTTAVLQVEHGFERNAVGTRVPKWHDVCELTGFIDLQSGDSKISTFNAKIQESTHIFVGDYKPIPDTLEIDGEVVRVDAETVRMVANSKVYGVKLIDDPMDLHKQLEIYLNYTGGQ